MTKLLGIFKELRDSEDLVAETPDFVTVEGGSNVFGTDAFDAKIYLTNQRLLFLIARIMDWKKMNKEAKGFWESLMYGQPKKDSTAMITTWMELPLETVKSIDTPSGFFSAKKSQLIMEFETYDKKGFWNFLKKSPKVIVHLDNRDMWRTQIEHHKRNVVGNFIQKAEEKPEVEDRKHEPPHKEVKSKQLKVDKLSPTKSKFCSSCGKKLANSKFCTECGERA